MNVTVRSACACLLLAWALPGSVCAEEHGWPVEPVDADHPLANTMGEFWLGAAGAYQHEGIDILARPFDQPSAPFAVVTVGGRVDWVNMNANSRDNYLRIITADGQYHYKYDHLEFSTLEIPVVLSYNNTNITINDPRAWPMLVAGDKIAQLTNLFPCGFDHLHYEVERINSDDSLTLVNPLLDIEPRPDPLAPKIVGIHLAQSNGAGWDVIEPDSARNSCIIVKDKVDIVVQVQDRDDAGSTNPGAGNVGLYNLRWRACKDSSPDCAWNATHEFKEMPAEWTVQGNLQTPKQFSISSPFRSTADMCPGSDNNLTFMVPTSGYGADGWKTHGGDYPNGGYTVSVEASDIAGGVTIDSVHVCVQNAGR